MANSFYNHHFNPLNNGYNPQIRPFSSKPKTINIPVNFVSSSSAAPIINPPAPTPVSTPVDRNTAAITIQKTVRGFLVRSNLRAVRQIAMEVDEIERKLRGDDEFKIGVEEKARIRVSEELMALLLRLDSVRWVRDLRKKMIRRVMILQEFIDSIGNSSKNIVTEDHEESMKSDLELEIETPGFDSKTVVTEDHQELINESMKSDLEMEIENQAMNMEIGEDGRGSPEVDMLKVAEVNEELRGMKEIMERMALENESLKMMVSRLCETSAEQCRLMEGLAGRVSNLERVVHRMDRRKKSKSAKSGAAARQ